MRFVRSRIEPSRGIRGRPARLRGLSALACLLLAFIQLSGAIHLALTPHRFCPLHGLEDVHGPRSPAPSAPETLTPERPTSIGSPLVAEFSGEACVLASRAHDPLTGVQPADPGCLSARVAAPRLGPDQVSLPSAGQALLLLAPKQGPPA